MEKVFERGSGGVREWRSEGVGTTKYTKYTKWEAESEWPCRSVEDVELLESGCKAPVKDLSASLRLCVKYVVEE